MYLLLALLLLPVPALAIPLSYNFSGTLGDGGSVLGSLTYDPSVAPIATDVRGLLGNAVYAPTSWNFTIHSPFVGSTLTGQNIEFCEGKCLFGTLAATTLRIGTTAGIFQMAFEPNFGEVMLRASYLRTTDANGLEWAILMTSGQATGQATSAGSVPLPSTFFLFAAGFGLIPCLRQWASYSMRRLSSQLT